MSERMSPELHLMSLKLLREIIASGISLGYYDDTTIGSKKTECSWGLCTESKEVYPESIMHIWPDDFEKHGRIAPRHRDENQKCPFDVRPIEEKDMNGCFWYCQIFQRKKRKQRITREYALQLFDEEIERYEASIEKAKE